MDKKKEIMILVVSDTHGDITLLEKLAKKYKNYDYLIHLGDYVEDVYKVKFDGIVVPVRGNRDLNKDAEQERVLQIMNHKIFLTHGHKYHVKYGLDRLFLKSLEINSTITLFGHTHVPFKENIDGAYLLNPGSLSRPAHGNIKTYGIIKLTEDFAEVNIVEFE